VQARTLVNEGCVKAGEGMLELGGRNAFQGGCKLQRRMKLPTLTTLLLLHTRLMPLLLLFEFFGTRGAACEFIELKIGNNF